MWLILKNAYSAMFEALGSSNVQASEVTAYENSFALDDNRRLSVAGDKAEIEISGILTPRPSFMAAFFGGGNTTYAEIISAIDAVEQNEDIKEAIFRIDSPGGSVDGMFDAMSAIANMKTPNKAIVSQAASAAFGLASQADEIVASSKAAVFGSIGIVSGFFIEENFVEITSSNAENKRPDVSTEKGKAVVREFLDEIETLFGNQIAAGRRTTREKVNAEFGRGSVMLAESALKRGMIDSIQSTGLAGENAHQPNAARKGGELNERARPMNLEELKAKHPDVHAQAVAEGIDQGQKLERDRASAHLTYGEKTGAITTAIKAVRAGTDLNQSVIAEYMTAGMNKVDTDNRSQDEIAAAEVADGVDDSDIADKEKEASVNILALAAESLGVNVEVSNHG